MQNPLIAPGLVWSQQTTSCLPTEQIGELHPRSKDMRAKCQQNAAARGRGGWSNLRVHPVGWRAASHLGCSDDF